MSWKEILKANVIWGKPKKDQLQRDKEIARQMESLANESCCEEARMKILQLLQHDLDSGEIPESKMASFNKIYERVDKATCHQLRMEMEDGAADGDESAILVLDEWKRCVKG
tara:strand:+ start:229 stop:564 length:336 start_codon:yes stop_codon:yes gene_type:complete